MMTTVITEFNRKTSRTLLSEKKLAIWQTIRGHMDSSDTASFV
jgi:hypothetical protein